MNDKDPDNKVDSSKSNSNDLYMNLRKESNKNTLSNLVFIQSEQLIVDKGKRFLLVNILLITFIVFSLVMIKYSLDWATTGKLELNKLKEYSKKYIIDKIKLKNNSIARIDLNQ